MTPGARWAVAAAPSRPPDAVVVHEPLLGPAAPALHRRVARAVAGLAHPHVVTLYDFGRADGRPYLVMELVDGGSLADRLGGAPADPDWAAGLVEPLARAVQYIHDRGSCTGTSNPPTSCSRPTGPPRSPTSGWPSD